MKKATLEELNCKESVRAKLKHNMQLRSEEHTSELQSPCNLVCRLLLEKKKNITERSTSLTTLSWSLSAVGAEPQGLRMDMSDSQPRCSCFAHNSCFLRFLSCSPSLGGV